MRRPLSDLFRLDGRIALLTGGAGHLGLTLARTLLEQGATVVLTDRDASACANRCSELDDQRVAAITCDLMNEDQIRAMVSKVCTDYGRLDIVVHNAAYVGTTKVAGWSELFANQSLQAWRDAMSVNCDAAFIIAQAAADALRKSAGSMVLVGSIYGHLAPQWSLYDGTSMHNPAAYGVSKAGVIQLMKYLATVLAPARVNAISPGGIARGQDPLFVKRYNERTPLGRMATEEDIQGALAYLVSDASSYVTAHNLMVDGGWSAW